jgi:hypothetical protein
VRDSQFRSYLITATLISAIDVNDGTLFQVSFGDGSANTTCGARYQCFVTRHTQIHDATSYRKNQ